MWRPSWGAGWTAGPPWSTALHHGQQEWRGWPASSPNSPQLLLPLHCDSNPPQLQTHCQLLLHRLCGCHQPFPLLHQPDRLLQGRQVCTGGGVDPVQQRTQPLVHRANRRQPLRTCKGSRQCSSHFISHNTGGQAMDDPAHHSPLEKWSRMLPTTHHWRSGLACCPPRCS